jgi:hypothetical protein
MSGALSPNPRSTAPIAAPRQCCVLALPVGLAALAVLLGELRHQMP